VFQDRRYRAHVEDVTCWKKVVDKGDGGDESQILVFGKVELNEMCVMDGGTLNLVTDDNPVIFDVGSSKRGIG
jgi:hypothetical protein